MIKYILLFSISLTILLYVANISFGEKKVGRDRIPEKIRSYIDTEYKGAKKVKYYIESDQDTTLYEVELMYQKQKYSFTFLANGTLYQRENKSSLQIE